MEPTRTLSSIYFKIRKPKPKPLPVVDDEDDETKNYFLGHFEVGNKNFFETLCTYLSISGNIVRTREQFLLFGCNLMHDAYFFWFISLV